jgi:hypothetical protein
MRSESVCTPLQELESAQEKLQTLAMGLIPPNVDSQRNWRQAAVGSDLQPSAKLLRASDSDATDRLIEINAKIAAIDRKLEQIAISLGVRGVSSEGDDEEDRKRLKEKLKQAIEADRRSRVRTIISRGEVWLEYIFGICRPDQRIGKRGSRWPVFLYRKFIVIGDSAMYCGSEGFLTLWTVLRLIHPRSRFTSGALDVLNPNPHKIVSFTFANFLGYH